MKARSGVVARVVLATMLAGWGAALAVAGVVAAPAGASSDHTVDLTLGSNGTETTPTATNDGRYVFFGSDSTNLVPGFSGSNDFNYEQAYVADRQSGTIAPAVTGPGGVPVDYDVDALSASSTGRYLAFDSAATNLTGELDADYDVFLYDRATDEATNLTKHVRVDGDEGTTVNRTGVSTDGNTVVFDSYDQNLVSEPVQLGINVFAYYNGHLELVSTDANGVPDTGDSQLPAVSADGRDVAFESSDGSLVSGDTNGFEDVFVKDLTTGAVTKVSTPPGGGQADWDSVDPSVSDDGRYVSFLSGASNLAGGPFFAGNHNYRAYRYDMQTQTMQLAETDSFGREDILGGAIAATISPGGRYVAFIGDGPFLSPGVSGQETFVKDMDTGILKVANISDTGVPASGGFNSGTPSDVLDDGSTAFASNETIGTATPDVLADIYFHQVGAPATQPAVVTVTAPATVHLGETVSFSAAVDSRGAFPVGYHYDYGDGTTDDRFDIVGGAADRHVSGSHLFSAVGTYTITVSVLDDDDRTTTGAATVQVLPPNQPPVAQIAATPASGAAPLAVKLSAKGSRDPDGSIVNYEFNFGDGSPATSGTAASVKHTYATLGEYFASVTVTDDSGATTVASTPVMVSAAPITKASGKLTVKPGSTGKGSLVVSVSIKRNKDGTYTGTVKYADAKAHAQGTCAVDPDGVTRVVTNGATVTATCSGTGAQAGLTGPAQFVLQDRSSVPAGDDSVSVAVGGGLSYTGSGATADSTLLIVPVDPTGGGGGGTSAL